MPSCYHLFDLLAAHSTHSCLLAKLVHRMKATKFGRYVYINSGQIRAYLSDVQTRRAMRKLKVSEKPVYIQYPVHDV